MTLSVQTLDRKIWRKDRIISYLYQCLQRNQTAILDFGPEGSCAESLGMYRLLDEFCEVTGFDPARIEIKTANVLEHHPRYKITVMTDYWYEIKSVNTWIKDKTIDSGTHPVKHFSNFVSRSNWFRLWIATILDKYHADKTLQTYHYDPSKENYNYNGYLGLDDLVKFDCDLLEDATKFLGTCPRTIDVEFLKVQSYSESIFQHGDSYYPIQYPANLNLLQYYKDIFVDIVCEPNASGNCFLCTEKTWRPIVARRPFIVMSNFNFLQNLKKLGFKTFDQFWDESYDDHSESQRIRAIQSLLHDLSQWPVARLHSTLIDMQKILDHNYRVFSTLTWEKIHDEFQL